jgi:signal transduction histidine kinase
LLAYILGGNIYKPVDLLLKATAVVSEGRLDYRIPVISSIKEFGLLAVSFNKMAEKLGEREVVLIDTNKKLKTVNKNYVDMVGFVSHELKGMLGPIIMNTYSLKGGFLGKLNERQQSAADSSARSLEHFECMVKNYLDLSRIETGELEVRKTEVWLNEDVIAPAVKVFKKQCGYKKISIASDIERDIKITADRELISIVCNNLLSNAVKYGAAGGIINVKAAESPDCVKVEFYNDGSPIKAGEVNTLFKRFSRLENSGKVKGTGLGLFIVSEIIKKHNGKIWVEPEPNGNRFIFTLLKTKEDIA